MPLSGNSKRSSEPLACESFHGFSAQACQLSAGLLGWSQKQPTWPRPLLCPFYRGLQWLECWHQDTSSYNTMGKPEYSVQGPWAGSSLMIRQHAAEPRRPGKGTIKRIQSLPIHKSLGVWNEIHISWQDKKNLNLQILWGNSLAVQWWGLHASTAGNTGSVSGWGIKVLQAVWHGKKKKKNHLYILCICIRHQPDTLPPHSQPSPISSNTCLAIKSNILWASTTP